MNQYRKKPVVIEARQITAENRDEIAAWCGGVRRPFTESDPIQGVDVQTLEGTMHGNDGDWIIRGVQGEFYPCKPNIFAATYEPAAAPSPSAAHAALLAEVAEHNATPCCANLESAIYLHGLLDRIAAALRAASPSPGAVEAAYREGYGDGRFDELHGKSRAASYVTERWEFSAARRGAAGGQT